MPQMDPHVQIARKIRSVESVKTHMIEQLAEIFRTIQSGNEREMSEALGGLVGLSYFLGRKLGLDLAAVDTHAQSAWMKTLSEEELDESDMEFVRRYLQSLR